MTFRGFIAVDVPADPRLENLAVELRLAGPSLKIVRTDQLHLTVKFLGPTEEGLVPEIVAAIRKAVADVSPFEIRIRGTGAFPNLGRMNVVWVGIEGADPIANVAEALERSLEPLGFPRERRPWRAHLTLARVKGRRNLDPVRRILEARATDDFGSHRVDRIELKKSVLAPDGAQYSVVESVPLEGRLHPAPPSRTYP